MTEYLFMRNPQKYNPVSDKSACLILRKTVETLDLISNLPLASPLQNEGLSTEANMEEIQRGCVLLASLNQMIWEGELEKLEHSSVTSSPDRTSAV